MLGIESGPYAGARGATFSGRECRGDVWMRCLGSSEYECRRVWRWPRQEVPEARVVCARLSINGVEVGFQKPALFESKALVASRGVSLMGW